MFIIYHIRITTYAFVIGFLTAQYLCASQSNLETNISLAALLAQTPQEQLATLSSLPADTKKLLKTELITTHRQMLAQMLAIQVQQYTGLEAFRMTLKFRYQNNFALTVAKDTQDATAYLYEWGSTTENYHQLAGHTDHVIATTLSTDEKYGLTGSKDKTARLWDISTRKCIKVLTGHTGWVIAVALSPDSRFAVTGSEDATVRLWDLSTYDSTILAGHTGMITSLTFSADSRLVLTGSVDSTARLWNATSGECIKEFTKHAGPVWSVALSPDGQYALIGSEDKTASLWHWATGHTTRLTGNRGPIMVVAFSPDGRHGLIGSKDGSACLWSLTTPYTILLTATQEQSGDSRAPIISAAFSSNGKYVLTTASNNIAYLWNILHLEELNLEQLLLMFNLTQQTPINLNDPQIRKTVMSLTPASNICCYPTNPLIKTAIDVRRKQLLEAAACDDIDTVKLLLKKGFCLNTCDKNGRNLWHYAFKGSIQNRTSQPSSKVLQLLVSLDGNNNGLKKVSKQGLPAFAEGIIYNTEFTRAFLNLYCISQDSNSINNPLLHNSNSNRSRTSRHTTRHTKCPIQ